MPIIDTFDLKVIIDTFDLMPIIDTFDSMPIIDTFDLMSIIDTFDLMSIIDTFDLIFKIYPFYLMVIVDTFDLMPIIDTFDFVFIIDTFDLMVIIDTFDLMFIIRHWAGCRPPPSPRGNFVHYNFLKLHYIRHNIKDVSPLRVAALMCNLTLYMLPTEIALNVPDNVSTMTCSYTFACWHRFMNFLWHSYIFLVLIL